MSRYVQSNFASSGGVCCSFGEPESGDEFRELTGRQTSQHRVTLRRISVNKPLTRRLQGLHHSRSTTRHS
ncbi:hypothetical protein EYF80_022667 [Liparis tanakae]|uniref:Uncharacterized protein n=1 Tax=Liparis tanakae TaxID=230148 RepID=A0A4Z2HN12_9TELE|nr:hypothetical protein EYF80_022667 [Liparis tanakae]